MGAHLAVTAPVVVVRDESGAQHYFYEGAVLPAGLDGDHVKLLLDDGLVGEVEASAEDAEVSGPPAKAAPKADWEAYARSQGATDADLEGQTKEDLVANYGG